MDSDDGICGRLENITTENVMTCRDPGALNIPWGLEATIGNLGMY